MFEVKGVSDLDVHRFKEILLVGNVKGILEMQWSRKKGFSDEVGTLRELTYLGDGVVWVEDVRLL